MAIKKGLLCQDEQKTQGIYPYTQTDCVFDDDGTPQKNINQNMAESLATINASLSNLSNLIIRSSTGSDVQTFDLSKIQTPSYPIFLFTAGYAAAYVTAMIYLNAINQSDVSYSIISSKDRSITSAEYNSSSKILTITLNNDIYRSGALLRLQ